MASTIGSNRSEGSISSSNSATPSGTDSQVKRKAVQTPEARLSKQRAKAEASLKDVGKAWQAYHYDKADGLEVESPEKGAAV